MTSQQRRFGSPDFAVRNESMMYQLPTNFLETVKPGVELIGGDKPLKGPKYNENPYFDWEEELGFEEVIEPNHYINNDIDKFKDLDKNYYERQNSEWILTENEQQEIENQSVSSKSDANLELSYNKSQSKTQAKDELIKFKPKLQNLDNGIIFLKFFVNEY